MSIYKFRAFYIFCVLLLPFSAFCAPYLNTVNHIDFGDLLGFPGSCEMNGDTGVISNLTGNFCLPDKTGTPGLYIIVSSPNKIIRIRINSKANTGNGIRLTPSGIYEVTDEADVAIIPDQFQDIDTGSYGSVFIRLGGSISAAAPLSFGGSYPQTNVVGIEWNELP